MRKMPTIVRKFSGTYENDAEKTKINPKTDIVNAIIKPKM